MGTVSADLKTLQSRIEDSKKETEEDSENSLGEAERKNLIERAEQAEDRMLSFVTEIEELRQKLDSANNSLESESRQLSQCNEDNNSLKQKMDELEKNNVIKDGTIKTSKCILSRSKLLCILSAQEKLRKVVNKCKSDKNVIEELKNKIITFESKHENSNEKFSKTREAQKLAEVKVMELEQRLTSANSKANDATDDKEALTSKFEDANKAAKEYSKKYKDSEKERKALEVKLIQIEKVLQFITFIHQT